jgi:hypothetical protein
LPHVPETRELDVCFSHIAEPAVNLRELVMIFGLAVIQSDRLLQFSSCAGEVVECR